jgi:hypothetical protein
MDGTVIGRSEADEFVVTMADGTRHRYVRTAEWSEHGTVYAHGGRV